MIRICTQSLLVIVFASLLPQKAIAVTKPHVISFGKWTVVAWNPGLEGGAAQTLKVRALMVDGRVKEYFEGAPHEVTERLFVVRRVFRINDSLPEDSGNPHWLWQRGGWLLVDRMSGKISVIALPEFDADYSAASWYRDYAAYCGLSDDGKKTYAIVAEVSRRKAVLKKVLAGEGIAGDAARDAACPAPLWQRMPARVSFDVPGSARETFAVRGRVVDMISDDEQEAEGSK